MINVNKLLNDLRARQQHAKMRQQSQIAANPEAAAALDLAAVYRVTFDIVAPRNQGYDIDTPRRSGQGQREQQPITPAEISGNDFTGSQSGVYLSGVRGASGAPFIFTGPNGSGPNMNTYGNHTGTPVTLNDVWYFEMTGLNLPVV